MNWFPIGMACTAKTTPMAPQLRGAFLALIIPAVLFAGAYLSQWLGLFPCEMCWWQRWAHMAALPPALFAIITLSRKYDRRWTRIGRIAAYTAAAFILLSGAIGIYHAGIEYHLWEGHTACTATVSNGANADDILREIMSRPFIRCDQPQWTLLGVSLAGFNAIISSFSAAMILGLIRRT